jgi:hypothetical protein
MTLLNPFFLHKAARLGARSLGSSVNASDAALSVGFSVLSVPSLCRKKSVGVCGTGQTLLTFQTLPGLALSCVSPIRK